MWKLDLKKEIWSPYETTGTEPTGRSDFSHVKIGNNLVVYGGLGKEGLLGDIYSLNIEQKTWDQFTINSVSKPSPRKGACMVNIGYFIYIFGGITDTGYTNELWKLDIDTKEFELIIGRGDIPIEIAYANCQIVDRNKEFFMQIYTGQTIGAVASPFIYEYNLDNKVWSQVNLNPIQPYMRSKAASIILGDKLIVAGGNLLDSRSFDTIESVDLKTSEVKTIGTLVSKPFHAASVYYKDKIYIQGGGDSFGTFSLANLPNNYLHIIELNDEESETWPCSKGSYRKDNYCEVCPVGTYNERIGSDCIPCLPGYYSNNIASDSITHCLPCSEGYYNPKEAQGLCIECPSSQICNIGTINPIEFPLTPKIVTSIQPEIYSNPSSQNAPIIIDYLIISLMILIVIFLFISNKLKHTLKDLDIFIYLHNHFLGQPMFIKKTYIGGLFSIGFLAFAVSVISKLSINYLHQNIIETKMLVPLVTLEKDYKAFKASEIIFQFSLYGYGDRCVKEEYNCVDELEFGTQNINGKFLKPYCEDLEYYCFIRLTCNNCELQSSGKLSLVLSEGLSFATDIQVNVTSSSSIPDEYSSTTIYIEGGSDKLFRGIEPTKVNLLMTPSLYLSDVPDWDSELTGYHTSKQQDIEKGSLINTNELAYSRNLRVDLYLDKNDSVLVTQRNNKQTFYLFASSLLASIVGVMGAFGFGMRKTEAWYERIMYKRSVAEMKKVAEENERRLLASFEHIFNLEDDESHSVKNICMTVNTESKPKIDIKTSIDSTKSEVAILKDFRRQKSCNFIDKSYQCDKVFPMSESNRNLYTHQSVIRSYQTTRYNKIPLPDLSLKDLGDASISDIIYNTERQEKSREKSNQSLEVLDIEHDSPISDIIYLPKV